MKRSLAFDPFFHQSITDAVGKAHKTGVLIRGLRIATQSELDVVKNILLQGSCCFGDGGRILVGVDISPPVLACLRLNILRSVGLYCIVGSLLVQLIRNNMLLSQPE